MSDIKCTNESCTKKRQCKHWHSKSENLIRLSSDDGFTPCIQFSCHQHQFIHVHGSKNRECANCGLIDTQYKNVSHDGIIEWSFA